MAKKMTIDDLAVIVKHGFDAVDKRFGQVAMKEDLKRFATKDDLRQLEHKMDAGFEGVNRRVDLLREDISDLPEIREEVTDLGRRVDRVEQKVGFGAIK